MFINVTCVSSQKTKNHCYASFSSNILIPLINMLFWKTTLLFIKNHTFCQHYYIKGITDVFAKKDTNYGLHNGAAVSESYKCLSSSPAYQETPIHNPGSCVTTPSVTRGLGAPQMACGCAWDGTLRGAQFCFACAALKYNRLSYNGLATWISFGRQCVWWNRTLFSTTDIKQLREFISSVDN